MSGDTVVTVAAGALVLLGLGAATISVYGLYRLPDVHAQLHAATKTAVIGVVLLLAATLLIGDVTIAARAVLLAAFLLLTAPVSTHVIARAAAARARRSGSPRSR